MERYVTVQEAAKLLGITPGRVRELVALGKLQAERAGARLWLIERSAVEQRATQPVRAGRPRKPKEDEDGRASLRL